MSQQGPQLAELLAPVEPEMERMRAHVAQQLQDTSAVVGDLTAHVSRFRGKQLRAGLVLLTAKATGQMQEEHPAVAAVVEMIHLATLVHDDILDGAEVRRRVACVNQRWNNQIAVLLGDFLYARAFALSTSLSSRLCSSLLADTTRTLCVGEIEQSTRRYDFELRAEEVERIAGAKTASLYAAACELGASYQSGVDEPARPQLGAALRAYGWELGLAFQLVDDCLDIVGDEAEVGKTVGTDVEDGKVTLPVLYTYQRAGAELRTRIRDIYTLPDLEGRARLLREVCDLSAGVEATLVRARELVASARSRLEGLPPSPARSRLSELGDFVLARRW